MGGRDPSAGGRARSGRASAGPSIANDNECPLYWPVMARGPETDDGALAFCDQCGWLQPGVNAECERCGVPLDRSVYDPLVAIHQNAAVVRQAVRGRIKPSGFGKFALVALGLFYLATSGALLQAALRGPFSLEVAFWIVLDLVVGLAILSAFHRVMRRDSWDEYRKWSS